MMQTVSVVIPAWRAAATIERAITSALRQTVPVAEIIVVDDGSPDNTAGVVTRFGHPVRLIRQANAGASAARNTGIAAATGDLIGFLDADDEWMPDRIERQLSVLRQHPEVGFVAGRYQSVSQVHEPPREVGPSLAWCDRPLQVDADTAWALAMVIWTGTVLIRRNLLTAEAFRPDLRTAEDRDLWIRILRTTPSWLTAKPVAVQHVVPGSLSLRDPDDDCRNMLRLIELHGSHSGPAAIRAREVAVYRRWAGVHLAEGRSKRARRPAWERLRRDPLSPEAWGIMIRTLVP